MKCDLSSLCMSLVHATEVQDQGKGEDGKVQAELSRGLKNDLIKLGEGF